MVEKGIVCSNEEEKGISLRYRGLLKGVYMMWKKVWMLLLIFCLLTPGTAAAADAAADTIYQNGKIITVDQKFSIQQAVAVKEGKIVAVGTNASMAKYKGASTKTVDLGGKTMMPGMMDTHLHFMRYGVKFLQIDCIDKSKEQIVAEVKDKAQAFGNSTSWVRGNGWNQELWDNPVFPDKKDLDAVAPNNPVALIRSDNHALWVNSKALAAAGITRDTKDPAGGIIHRDSQGEPTGILVDNAMSLVNDQIPPWTEAEKEMAYLAADKSYASVGLTTVADAGDDSDIPMLTKLYTEDKIFTRVYSELDRKTADVYLANNTPAEWGLLNDRLDIRSIKLKTDGALGSRGAQMMTDYSDMPGVTGNTLISKEELITYTQKADKLGYQLVIHAIGDRANRNALDAIEYSIAQGNKDNKNRHSILHAQVLSMADIPRFGKLNVPALVQPVHCTGDMGMAETRLGPWRILGAYAWRSLMNQGIILAGGSDNPNDYLEPLYGIHAFVTRQNRDSLPVGGWYPQECLTVEEAIRAYTIDSAYIFFQEESKGSIEPGKLADFVVLSDDILTVPKEDIHKIQVVKTIIGDKEVYSQ